MLLDKDVIAGVPDAETPTGPFKRPSLLPGGILRLSFHLMLPIVGMLSPVGIREAAVPVGLNELDNFAYDRK